MKEDSYFVDTNIFLRVLLKVEAKTFGACLEFLRKIKKRELNGFTSNLILATVAWILLRTYKFTGEKSKLERLNSILKLKNLKIKDNFKSQFSHRNLWKISNKVY